MAESYSVKAVLSAVDRGFSSTLKNCASTLDKIDSKISGFSFGVLTGAGQEAFNAITSSASNLVNEIDSSNAAWKTFSSNMSIIGKSEGEIKGVKKELQEFAQQTVYSSSDMASTYAQLASVGTKNTSKLVKGFGGLAAAAENPQQAMKTLSQQAVQMAAKPNVAWADFKLMLEQTPAGISAVAKEMGMSASEMVTAVQKGAVKTEDFFDAIQKVGTSKSFATMATEAKTIGQAVDGMKETLANKLMPAFDQLTKYGIKAVESLTSKLEGINANKLISIFGRIIKYGKSLMPVFASVKNSLSEAFVAIKTSFEDLTGKFGSDKSIEGFKGLVESVANVIKKVAEIATKHADKIALLIKYLPQIVLGLKGFKIAKTVAPFVTTFASGIASLASKGIGGIAGKLFGIAKSQSAVGTSSAKSSANMFSAAKSYAMMGVAVLTIAAGFALLAYSSIQLANAGGLAIGVMAGMVATIALLAVGAAALAPALTAGAVGLVAFGVAVLLVATGALLAATALSIISKALPSIVTHGSQGAATIITLSNAMIAFAVGASMAGAASIALGAGLTVAGAGAVVAAVGITALGAGVVVCAAGFVAMAASLKLVSSQMKNIAKNAKTTQSSLNSMKNSVKLVESGLNALGSNAKTSIKAVTDALRSGRAGAYSAGAYISQGFAQGMRSCLSEIRSAAEQMAAAAEKAVRAKAKIHSPSKVSESLGEYWGEGYVGGLESMVKDAWKVAQELVSVPSVATPNLATAYGYEMSGDYEYYRNNQYVIEVPLAVDGREFARATASYTEEALGRKQTRDYRKEGRV